MQSIIRHCAANGLPQLPSLAVRQSEVKFGPDVLPNLEGEAEYGFKRGMDDEGLVKQVVDTYALVLEHRQACFAWRKSLRGVKDSQRRHRPILLKNSRIFLWRLVFEFV